MLMDMNGLAGGTYVEPYAGGAGVAIALLSSGHANHVHINDLNPAVYAFWKSVFVHSDALCRKIRDTPVTIENWKRQKAILAHPKSNDELELGFAAFFLNRTNRSGILTGGVIGGQNQEGNWRMDARYNKVGLCLKIETISTYADQVSLYQLDAEKLLSRITNRLPKKTLIYLDPPYFVKSKRLYEDLYTPKDHARLATNIRHLPRSWVVSYDDVPQIRKLYLGCKRLRYGLSYSAGSKCQGAEALFFSPDLNYRRCTESLDVTGYG